MEKTITKKYTIKDYCDEKKITLDELAVMTGVSKRTIYNLSTNRNKNLTIKVITKIYNGTKKKFGKGVPFWDYLDYPSLM